MDARLAKIRERKQRKLREAGLIDNAQENDVLEENMQAEHMQEEQTQKEQTQVTTQEISNQDDEEETATDENEKYIGTMIHRIRNKSTKIEKAHLNEWEKGKVGKNLLFLLYLSFIFYISTIFISMFQL